MRTIAIIGAGPCGLSTLNAFDKERKTSKSFKVTCFEQQAFPGGLWNYSWKTGLNEFNEPVHCSQYMNLWSNGPKEGLEFPDYTFKQHFGRSIGSYPPRVVLRDYLLGRIEYQNKNYIKDYIKLLHKVIWVEALDNNQFEVTYQNLMTGKIYKSIYDYVIVATGHFSYPNIPNYDNTVGFNEFSGSIIHSHDFRNSKLYKDKHVLVVGSSYSAEDISLQLYKYGAKKVSISYRRKPMDFHWPHQIKEYPEIECIKNGSDVYFKNGEYVRDVDSIILCTGYKHYFPFLEESLRLKTRNIMYPDNLYKGVVWLDNNHLMYLGMSDQYYTFSMFDVQGYFAKDVCLNNISLPDKDTMKNDINKWVLKGKKLKGYKDDILFQTEYILDLCKYTNYNLIDNINKMDASKQFLDWEFDKHENILTYRDKIFQSNFDNTISVKLNTTWLNAKDDSLKSFVNNDYKQSKL